MPSEIAIPFRLGADGHVATESSPDAYVRQHVLSLINTQPGERTVLGDYGIPLADLLFEDDDEDLLAELGDQISNAFADWEPSIVLQDVDRADPTGRPDVGEARVQIAYARTDSPESQIDGRSANEVTIIAGGQVKEVIRG